MIFVSDLRVDRVLRSGDDTEVTVIRLIKLMILALAGYSLYELIRGMTQDAPGLQSQAGGGDRRRDARGRWKPRENITGPGRGVEQETEDSDGGTTRHKVGRGVVH
jgi:hypothetical protein